MSTKCFRSLIVFLAMGLLIAGGGSAFAASHEEGEEFTSDFIEGEEEGVRFEVLEGYVSPGVITDSMLLNAGEEFTSEDIIDKRSSNWALYRDGFSDFVGFGPFHEDEWELLLSELSQGSDWGFNPNRDVQDVQAAMLVPAPPMLVIGVCLWLSKEFMESFMKRAGERSADEIFDRFLPENKEPGGAPCRLPPEPPPQCDVIEVQIIRCPWEEISLLVTDVESDWVSVFARDIPSGEMRFFPTDFIAEGMRLEVLEGYVSPGVITDSMLLNAGKDPNNWILYGKDYAHTRYSHLDEINTETIKDLVPKWVLSFGVLDSQGSQTMAFNGNLFVSSSYNHVFRVDGRTGRTVWRYDHNLPGDVFPHLCCDVINRGPALYGTNLYVATLDGHLVALDSASGQVIWDHTVADYKASYSFTVLPLAVDGKIIIGTSGAEFGIRGFITARDSETGEEVWKTYTIPAPGEPGGDTWPGDTYKYGGGSAWVTGAYDPELNNIYWGVGQPGPWDRHAHPGDNLYTNSTVVMDPDSGAIKFRFQYTPNDPYDYDGVNEVVLADIDGQKVWLQADRNGHFYSIDRTNGSFNYAVPMGKVNWNRGFDPETGRPIFVYPEKDVTRDKVTEGIYPALFGGKEWNPMAYDPTTQIAYVPAFGDHSMDLQAKQEKYTRGELYLGIKVMKWYGGGGELRAINARNGELVWVHNNPMPFRSSVTATAGNLVFTGDTEGYIKAFNATTGAQVWSFYTGSSVMSGVSTFTVDGKQYLSAVVGQAQAGIEMFDENWKKTHQKGGHLIAFALH